MAITWSLSTGFAVLLGLSLPLFVAELQIASTEQEDSQPSDSLKASPADSFKVSTASTSGDPTATSYSPEETPTIHDKGEVRSSYSFNPVNLKI